MNVWADLNSEIPLEKENPVASRHLNFVRNKQNSLIKKKKLSANEILALSTPMDSVTAARIDAAIAERFPLYEDELFNHALLNMTFTDSDVQHFTSVNQEIKQILSNIDLQFAALERKTEEFVSRV